MSENDLAALLEGWRADLMSAEAAIDLAVARRDGYRKMIEGAEALLGFSQPATAPTSGRFVATGLEPPAGERADATVNGGAGFTSSWSAPDLQPEGGVPLPGPFPSSSEADLTGAAG